MKIEFAEGGKPAYPEKSPRICIDKSQITCRTQDSIPGCRTGRHNWWRLRQPASPTTLWFLYVPRYKTERSGRLDQQLGGKQNPCFFKIRTCSPWETPYLHYDLKLSRRQIALFLESTKPKTLSDIVFSNSSLENLHKKGKNSYQAVCDVPQVLVKSEIWRLQWRWILLLGTWME